MARRTRQEAARRPANRAGMQRPLRVRAVLDGAVPDRWIRLARPETAAPASGPQDEDRSMPPVVQQMFGGDDTVVYDTRQSVLKGHNGRLQIETDSDVDLDILTLLQQRGAEA